MEDEIECPHQDCKFKGTPEELKPHLTECSFGMREYIREFLLKKEEEMRSNSVSEEQLEDVQEALKNVMKNQNKNKEEGEYISEIMASTGKQLWQSIAAGLEMTAAVGVEFTGKAKEAVGKTTHAIVTSETWKSTKDALATTTEVVLQDINSGELLESINMVVSEIKQEIADSLASSSSTAKTVQSYQPPAVYIPQNSGKTMQREASTEGSDEIAFDSSFLDEQDLTYMTPELLQNIKNAETDYKGFFTEDAEEDGFVI